MRFNTMIRPHVQANEQNRSRMVLHPSKKPSLAIEMTEESRQESIPKSLGPNEHLHGNGKKKKGFSVFGCISKLSKEFIHELIKRLLIKQDFSLMPYSIICGLFMNQNNGEKINYF